MFARIITRVRRQESAYSRSYILEPGAQKGFTAGDRIKVRLIIGFQAGFGAHIRSAFRQGALGKKFYSFRGNVPVPVIGQHHVVDRQHMVMLTGGCVSRKMSNQTIMRPAVYPIEMQSLCPPIGKAFYT